jgi:hypothetical protein
MRHPVSRAHCLAAKVFPPHKLQQQVGRPNLTWAICPILGCRLFPRAHCDSSARIICSTDVPFPGFGLRLPRLTGPLGLVRAGVGRKRRGLGTADGARHFLVRCPEAASLVRNAIYRRGATFSVSCENRVRAQVSWRALGNIETYRFRRGVNTQLSIVYATDEIPLESRESISQRVSPTSNVDCESNQWCEIIWIAGDSHGARPSRQVARRFLRGPVSPRWIYRGRGR